MKNECCIWRAEIIDDTLKTLFQADGALGSGNFITPQNREIAKTYIKVQKERLPIIVSKAVSECGGISEYEKNAAEDLYNHLDELEKDIEKGKNIHEKVIEIDKKYALPNYEAFSRCIL